MATPTKTKLISAARAKNLKKGDRGKALKHPPKGSAVEAQEGQYKLVSCPAGDMNFVEYDPNRYQWFQCTVCGCSFEM
jgi:hypothetical protein